MNKRISSYECTERLRFLVLATASHRVTLRTILKKLTGNPYSISSFILYIYYIINFYFLQKKPITGIEPVFEPWRGPVFTTIRHRQNQDIMRILPRHIFAPCQAESILATYSRGRVLTIPLDWFECPITPYLLNHLSKDRRHIFIYTLLWNRVSPMWESNPRHQSGNLIY